MRHAPWLIVVSCLVAVPAQGQDLSAAPDLTVTASFSDGRWLAPDDPIELRLSVPLNPEVGRLAVLIGRTDWTDLFEVTATALRSRPRKVSLPRGESDVTVFLVTPGGQWQQIAQVPLRVLHAGGFEQVDTRPTVEVSSQGQAAFDRDPAQPGERERFHDTKISMGVLTTLKRAALTSRAQANVVGVTNEQEALRFGTEGAGAPAVDLADYLVDLEHARGRFSVGHVQWDAHRYLVSAFGSRGLAGTIKLAPAVDLSLHAMNGTSIVGWSNVFGLDRRAHQVRGTTLGVELRPSRPGALRLAASWLDGSLQPLTGFTEGLVNDAETSDGGAVRLTATDAGARLQVDAGYARSRFTNPADPLLAQDLAIVPVRETARAARYLDASYALLQGRRVGRMTASLTAALRHSVVDPLYRSVAAPVQADQLQNTVELAAGIGRYASQFTWTGGHDNLDERPFLLTTTTRTVAWTHALPLGSLRREPSPWLPEMNLALGWQHQFGDALPSDSLFDSLSQIPDQGTTTQALGLTWPAERWRASYQAHRSFQDNRQPGRERSDFETLVHTIGVGVVPHSTLDFGADLSFERSGNREAVTTDLTRRVGLTGTWRPASKTSLAAFFATTVTGNDPQTRDGTATDLNVQISQSVGFLKRRPDSLHAQLFVRFARQTLRSTDRLFDLVDRQQFWSVNTGLTFRVF